MRFRVLKSKARCVGLSASGRMWDLVITEHKIECTFSGRVGQRGQQSLPKQEGEKPGRKNGR